ncbi:hypothetical protein AAV99_01625 [Aurantiacibacter marinus]|uniref:Acyltransferase 3 domain-containing protein n=2 Tax=Aurantiacibacter marinus TaxID=874156 RepID=A0A0H0XP55_9SPHN|nr:hypothetical protein AAV99_01625 [Aurantiacibacter marinus]
MFVGAVLGLAINGGSLLTLLLVPTGEQVLFPANIPLWSLVYELIASILFAALFRYGRMVWGVVWVASGIVLSVAILTYGSADLGFSPETAQHGLFRVGYSFSSGIAAAYLVQVRPRISRWCIPFALMPLAFFMWPVGSVAVDILSILFVFPALTIALAYFETDQRYIATELGGLSYALYAIHHPIVKQADGAGLLYVPLFFAIIAVAWALERYFDRPLRRHLHFLISRRESSPD